MPDKSVICPNCRTRIPLSPSLLHRLLASMLEEHLAKERKTLFEKQLELKEQRRGIEETIARRVRRDVQGVRARAKAEAENELTLAIEERDLQLSSLREQIDELKRRAVQGSQQLQGEAQEVHLETILAQRFPEDILQPVAQGRSGGDIIQRVRDKQHKDAGTLLWESKRTRSWANAWLSKLREDQRRAKADLAIIVSHALPSNLLSFDLVEGVWVTHPNYAVPLAVALRHLLIQVSVTRVLGTAPVSVGERLYRYITGSDFRRHVERVAEQFASMKNDLERERTSTTRTWAKREAQIQAAIESTAALCVQLQTTTGKRLVAIDSLSDLPLISAAPR